MKSLIMEEGIAVEDINFARRWAIKAEEMGIGLDDPILRDSFLQDEFLQNLMENKINNLFNDKFNQVVDETRELVFWEGGLNDNINNQKIWNLSSEELEGYKPKIITLIKETFEIDISNYGKFLGIGEKGEIIKIDTGKVNGIGSNRVNIQIKNNRGDTIIRIKIGKILSDYFTSGKKVGTAQYSDMKTLYNSEVLTGKYLEELAHNIMTYGTQIERIMFSLYLKTINKMLDTTSGNSLTNLLDIYHVKYEGNILKLKNQKGGEDIIIAKVLEFDKNSDNDPTKLALMIRDWRNPGHYQADATKTISQLKNYFKTRLEQSKPVEVSDPDSANVIHRYKWKNLIFEGNLSSFDNYVNKISLDYKQWSNNNGGKRITEYLEELKTKRENSPKVNKQDIFLNDGDFVDIAKLHQDSAALHDFNQILEKLNKKLLDQEEGYSPQDYRAKKYQIFTNKYESSNSLSKSPIVEKTFKPMLSQPNDKNFSLDEWEKAQPEVLILDGALPDINNFLSGKLGKPKTQNSTKGSLETNLVSYLESINVNHPAILKEGENFKLRPEIREYLDDVFTNQSYGKQLTDNTKFTSFTSIPELKALGITKLEYKNCKGCNDQKKVIAFNEIIGTNKPIIGDFSEGELKSGLLKDLETEFSKAKTYEARKLALEKLEALHLLLESGKQTEYSGIMSDLLRRWLYADDLKTKPPRELQAMFGKANISDDIIENRLLTQEHIYQLHSKWEDTNSETVIKFMQEREELLKGEKEFDIFIYGESFQKMLKTEFDSGPSAPMGNPYTKKITHELDSMGREFKRLYYSLIKTPSFNPSQNALGRGDFTNLKWKVFEDGKIKEYDLNLQPNHITSDSNWIGNQSKLINFLNTFFMREVRDVFFETPNKQYVGWKDNKLRTEIYLYKKGVDLTDSDLKVLKEMKDNFFKDVQDKLKEIQDDMKDLNEKYKEEKIDKSVFNTKFNEIKEEYTNLLTYWSEERLKILQELNNKVSNDSAVNYSDLLSDQELATLKIHSESLDPVMEYFGDTNLTVNFETFNSFRTLAGTTFDETLYESGIEGLVSFGSATDRQVAYLQTDDIEFNSDWFVGTTNIPTYPNPILRHPLTMGGLALEKSSAYTVEFDDSNNDLGNTIFKGVLDLQQYPQLAFSWRLEELKDSSGTDRINDEPLQGAEIGFEVCNNSGSSCTWIVVQTYDRRAFSTEKTAGSVITVPLPYTKNFAFDNYDALENRDISDLNAYSEDPDSPWYNPVRSSLYQGQFQTQTINLYQLAESVLGKTDLVLNSFYLTKHDADARLTLGGIELLNTTSDQTVSTIFEPAKLKHMFNYYVWATADLPDMDASGDKDMADAYLLASQKARELATSDQAFEWVTKQREYDVNHKIRRYLIEATVLFGIDTDGDDYGDSLWGVSKATYTVPYSRTDLLAPISLERSVLEETFNTEENYGTAPNVYLYYDPLYQTGTPTEESVTESIDRETLDLVIDSIESNLWTKSLYPIRINADEIVEITREQSSLTVSNNMIISFGPLPETLFPSLDEAGNAHKGKTIASGNLLRYFVANGGKFITSGQFGAIGRENSIAFIDRTNGETKVILKDLSEFVTGTQSNGRPLDSGEILGLGFDDNGTPTNPEDDTVRDIWGSTPKQMSYGFNSNVPPTVSDYYSLGWTTDVTGTTSKRFVYPIACETVTESNIESGTACTGQQDGVVLLSSTNQYSGTNPITLNPKAGQESTGVLVAYQLSRYTGDQGSVNTLNAENFARRLVEVVVGQTINSDEINLTDIVNNMYPSRGQTKAERAEYLTEITTDIDYSGTLTNPTVTKNKDYTGANTVYSGILHYTPEVHSLKNWDDGLDGVTPYDDGKWFDCGTACYLDQGNNFERLNGTDELRLGYNGNNIYYPQYMKGINGIKTYRGDTSNSSQLDIGTGSELSLAPGYFKYDFTDVTSNSIDITDNTLFRFPMRLSTSFDYNNPVKITDANLIDQTDGGWVYAPH
ncbi:MAG: hypothetical protein ACXAC7_21455, partial [Candidatus Hodarchaeales archaeon]